MVKAIERMRLEGREEGRAGQAEAEGDRAERSADIDTVQGAALRTVGRIGAGEVLVLTLLV